MGQVNKKDDTKNRACHQTVLESRLAGLVLGVGLGDGAAAGVAAVVADVADVADDVAAVQVDKLCNFRAMKDKTPE